MEWYHWIMIALGVCGFVLQTLVLAIGGTWKLAQIEKGIIAKVNEHRTEVDGVLDAAQKIAIDRSDTMRREFGETVAALREALNLAMTELHRTRQWALETFSRRESVNSAMERIDKQLGKIGEKLDVLQAEQSKTAAALAAAAATRHGNSSQ